MANGQAGKRNHTGYFFDLYPVHGGMIVWFIGDDGRTYHCFDPFHSSFYMKLETCEIKRIAIIVQQFKLPVTIGKEKRYELFTGEEWEVTKITVHNPLQLTQCVGLLQRFFPHFVFYNSNIPVAQMYMYDRQVFPLAHCEFVIDEKNVLQQIIVNDSFDACNYKLPELRLMRLSSTDFPSKFSRSLNLEINYEGKTYTIEQNDTADVLHTLNWHLYHYDPDIIVSAWGDAALFPTLVNASKKCQIPLLLNRNQSQVCFHTQERNYWAYGQIIHRDAAFMLAGRWHIDAENSFIMGESDIEGVIELARLTQLPIQKQSRAAIGTGLASMQMSYAYKNNILIPAEKKEGEDFKTADQLLLSDRGGLIFMPDLGYHENVAELDFASMYPTLMEKHNISPETINCRCCYNSKVPELGYTICEKRRGIVPITLKPLLEKRAYYKMKKKTAKTFAEHQKYERRQNALKWMLVTCFGYLGYKNARFGRIEAHESVNAFSREALLTAKEIAEANGYHLVHAIIDCLWLKKHAATANDYLQLCQEIKNVVGVDISFEGIYNWILFPSSKTDLAIPTAQKYVGCYNHGELKIRGIEARRKDIPMYIRKMQLRLLEMMSTAKNIDEIKTLIPKLLHEAQFYLNELRCGRVDPKELVIRRRIQKNGDEYVNKNLNAMIVRELAQFGIKVKAGESIEFVIIDQTGKREPQKAKSLLTYQHWNGYDIEKYTELLLKAVETLLSPFGYEIEKLENYYDVGKINK